ncbi:hypothetical protein ACP6JA_05060 [Stutzerimonas frequens]
MADDKKHRTPTSLKDFVKKMNAPKEVCVSGQRFYVGHVGMSKLGETDIEKVEVRALGLKLVEELTFETTENSSKLSTERLAKLDDDERGQLAAAILKASGIESSSQEPLEELGQYFHTWRAKLSEMPRWSGVGETALAAIQQNMTGLASTSAALEGLRLGSSFELGKLPPSVAAILDPLGGDRATDGFFSVSEPTKNRLELPVIDWSRTPENRAAVAGEQTAERLEHVAGLLATMGRELNELTHTIVHTAIPQWMSQVRDEQDASNRSLRHASSGLKLTILALVVSVLLSLGQTWLSRLDSIDSDIRADANESLMRRQIEEMRELRNQMMVQSAEQHAQMKVLQQVLERLTETPHAPVVAPPGEAAKL